MASRRQRPIIPIPLPLYGLNDKQSPYAISDFEAADLENVLIGAKIMQSRQGYVTHGITSGSGPIYNAIDYRKSDGTNIEIRQRETAIEKLNTANNTWEALSLPITLTAGYKVNFQILNNLLLIANGIDSDLSFDGTTVTERSTLPKAKYQIIIDNRIVKLTDAGVVWFSEINDPLTYDALSFINIDPNNAAIGKGLGETNGQVIVFKQNKKYTLTQLVGGTVIPMDGDISTVSHYSIISTGSTLIFLGANGWYEIRGSGTYLISGHINFDNLDKSRLINAHAVFFNDRYRCFVTESGSSYNNLEYVIYTHLRTPFEDNPYPITKNRGLYGQCYYKTLRSNQELIYFGESRSTSGSPATNYSDVYEMFNGYSDNGSAIAAYFTSKLFDHGVPYFSKRYKRLYTRIINQAGLVYYVAYRFSTTAGWSEQALSISETVLSWLLDDSSETDIWYEDIDWVFEGSEDEYTPISNTGRPKTIQFRNRINSDAAQGQWVYQAMRLRVRDKFKP